MDEQLIIRLNKHDSQVVEWLILDAENKISQGPQQAPLVTLSKYAESHTISVLIPAEDVLMMQVNLPKMSQARLQKAVPFALEEELAEEIAQLHFAFGF